MLLEEISQGGQVQTRELLAGRDQEIGFSSRQKETEGQKNELSVTGFCFFSSKSTGVHTYNGVRSQRSDQVISVQDIQPFYFPGQPLLPEMP